MICLTVEEALWLCKFIEGGPIGDFGEKVQQSIISQIENAISFQDEATQ